MANLESQLSSSPPPGPAEDLLPIVTASYPDNWLGKEDVELISNTVGVVTLRDTHKVYCKQHPLGAHLRREYTILELLARQGAKTPPKVAIFRGQKDWSLVTEYVGEPLPTSDYQNVETFKELVAILQKIWECGIVHCDIKPEHIRKLDNDIRLIDFDLAYDVNSQPKALCKFKHLYVPNQVHLAKFRGTVPFASTNALLGLVPSASTDLESLFYTLCQRLKRTDLLPWFQDAWNCVTTKQVQQVFDRLPELCAQRISWIMTQQSDPLVSSLYHMITAAPEQQKLACQNFISHIAQQFYHPVDIRLPDLPITKPADAAANLVSSYSLTDPSSETKSDAPSISSHQSRSNDSQEIELRLKEIEIQAKAHKFIPSTQGPFCEKCGCTAPALKPCGDYGSE